MIEEILIKKTYNDMVWLGKKQKTYRLNCLFLNVGNKKKVQFHEKHFDNDFSFNFLLHSLPNLVLSLLILTRLAYGTDRQADVVCAEYFKLTLFWKKQFVKNESFTKF